MERLTEKHFGNEGYYMKCSEDCHAPQDCIDCAAFDKLVDRLAAYEDTGLLPEDFKKAFNEDALLKKTAQYLGTTPDRLHEWAKAEQEGRLVVLPCKVGDTVWFVRPLDSKKEITETTIEKMVVKGSGVYMKLACNAMYETSCNSIGKTVFLTREEAETALEGGNT